MEESIYCDIPVKLPPPKTASTEPSFSAGLNAIQSYHLKKSPLFCGKLTEKEEGSARNDTKYILRFPDYRQRCCWSQGSDRAFAPRTRHDSDKGCTNRKLHQICPRRCRRSPERRGRGRHPL